MEAACVQIPVQRDAIGADGLIGDPAIQNAIAAALNTLVEYVQRIAEKASS